MDVGYTQSNFSAQTRNVSGIGNVGFANIDGGNTALTFMLVGRYPLMVTPDYKNGRFSPYIGVGPTVRFSSYDFTNYGGNNTSATNVGLVTEAGVRYMVTPNFSAGVAYRYTYLPGAVNVALPGIGNANFAGTQNSHAGIVRLNYHF
jgi:opacity protein-like surface antigen